jgi:hypothetical protein
MYKGNIGTFPGKKQGNGLSDSAVCPGNEDILIV